MEVTPLQRINRAVGRAMSLAVLALCGVVASSGIAEACFCMNPCGTVLNSSLLFEGTVIAIEPLDGGQSGGTHVVRLADVRSVRGTPPRELVTGGSTCAFEFTVGIRYVIDAHEFEPGRAGTSLCSNTRPLAGAQRLLDFLMAPSAAARPRVWGTLGSRVAAPNLDARGGGPPIGGAIVTLHGPVERQTTSTATGGFGFLAVPEGDYQIVVELPRARTDVEPPPEQSFTLDRATACASFDLLASSTARVSGVVVTETGAAAPGVRVEVFPLPYDPLAGGFVTAATTDAHGRYAIEHVAPGLYGGGVGIPFPSDATPYASVRAHAPTGDVEIIVAPGAGVELLPLVARPVTPTPVSGVVRGLSGATVGGLFVVVSAVEGFPAARTGGVTTDAAGRFTLRAYRGVRYRLEVESHGRVVAAAEFVAGDGPLVVPLGVQPR